MKQHAPTNQAGEQGFIPRQDLHKLIRQLIDRGYLCLGPVLQDGAIQYLPVTGIDDLSAGMEVVQAPAVYHVRPGVGERLFSWSNGPQGLKPILFPPSEPLWQVDLDSSGKLNFSQTVEDAGPIAVLGVRACDLAALKLQDQHFLNQGAEDPQYKKRRESLLLIGVDCTHPSDTCFCVSTGDGPDVRTGFDLALSELNDGFILRAGTDRGRELLQQLEPVTATDDQLQQVIVQTQEAIDSQKRKLPDSDLPQQLFDRMEHSHWQIVAESCTACGSCTSVCPTCFCFSEYSETSLDGSGSQQMREWSSCFTPGHSTFCGHPVRADIASRYRQWVTHKMAGWHQQFGRSGCVGCGRCISWCPVGIDITKEVAKVVVDAK